MKRSLLAATALLAATPAIAAPDYAAAIKADYDRDLGALWDDLHRNPELSFHEVRTAGKMAAELRRIPGIVVTDKVGVTGVVGVLRNGDGPVVLVRADMDGLPVEEKSGLPNASKARQTVDGVDLPVMHACGHDVHMVALIATARRLAAMKDRWKGTIVFVAQPAEETLGGAKAMIADGLYTRFPKPQYALALHVGAGAEAGIVAASESTQYSSSDAIDIVVPGIGGHGAHPNETKDPVYMGAQMVIALQGVISRERQPLLPGVITVGTFHAGTKNNIIPDSAKLQLTVRANDAETRANLIAGVRRVAAGIGTLNGMPADKMPLVTQVAGTPPTVNDAPLTRRLNPVLAEALGADRVKPFVQAGMGAEDFAYYVQPETGVKGYFFAVGGTPRAEVEAAAAGKAAVASHHSPEFRITPEPAVIAGATAMTAAVLDLTRPGAGASPAR